MTALEAPVQVLHEGPLQAAQEQLTQAPEHLGLDEGLRALLARPRREMIVSVPLRRDDGSMAVQGVDPVRWTP